MCVCVRKRHCHVKAFPCCNLSCVCSLPLHISFPVNLFAVPTYQTHTHTRTHTRTHTHTHAHTHTHTHKRGQKQNMHSCLIMHGKSPTHIQTQTDSQSYDMHYEFRHTQDESVPI